MKKPKMKVHVISFKLGIEHFDKLEKYAKSQRDEAGMTMSNSQAARRLMLEALNPKTKPNK